MNDVYPELPDGDLYAPAMAALKHQIERTNAEEFLIPFDEETVAECARLLTGARESGLVPPIVVIDEADPITVDFHWAGADGARVLCEVYNGGRIVLRHAAAGEEHYSRLVHVDDRPSAVDAVAGWLGATEA